MTAALPFLFAATALLALAVIALEARLHWRRFMAIGAAVRVHDWHDVVRVTMVSTSPLCGWLSEPTGTVIYSAHFRPKCAAPLADLSEAA